MRKTNVKLFCRNLWESVIALKSFYVLYILFLILTAYSAVSSIRNYTAQNSLREAHQIKARASWEANPDKHPHRMAHFGTFAFRISPPLAIFDNGGDRNFNDTAFVSVFKTRPLRYAINIMNHRIGAGRIFKAQFF